MTVSSPLQTIPLVSTLPPKLQFAPHGTMSVPIYPLELPGPLVSVTVHDQDMSTVVCRINSQYQAKRLPPQQVPRLMSTLRAYPATELQSLSLTLGPSNDSYIEDLFAGRAVPRLTHLSLTFVDIPRTSQVFAAPLTFLSVVGAEIWRDWEDVLQTLRNLPALQTLVLDNPIKATQAMIHPGQLARSIALRSLSSFTLGVSGSWELTESILRPLDIPSNAQLSWVASVPLQPRTNRAFAQAISVLHNHVPEPARSEIQYTHVTIADLVDPAFDIGGCLLTAGSPRPHGGDIRNVQAPAQLQLSLEWHPDLGSTADDLPAVCSLLPHTDIRWLATLRVSHPWFASSREWLKLHSESYNFHGIKRIHVEGTALLRGLLVALAWYHAPTYGPRRGELEVLFPQLHSLVIEDVEFVPRSRGPTQLSSILPDLEKALDVRRRAGHPITDLVINKCTGSRSMIDALPKLAHYGQGRLCSVHWDGNGMA